MSVLEPVTRQSTIEYDLQDREQLCFIHVPKTAGTTFTSIVDARFNQQDICPAQLWGDLVKLSKEDLARYRLLRGHFPYYIHQWLPQKPVYITMLRDPLERVISAYEFARRWPSMRSHDKANTLSLPDFVADPEMFAVRNSQTRHFISQLFTTEVDLTDRGWIEEAKAHLEQFAFVGITERFQQSMALLSFTFGWPLATEYQNLMVTPRNFKRENLSEEAIAAVLHHNQLDVELYEFANQLFEQRYGEMFATLESRFPAVQEPGERFDQHYRQRFAVSAHPLRETVTFQFDQPLWGTGWHLREGTPEQGGVFRWLGPGTTATLDLPLTGDRPLTVELRIVNAITPDVLNSFRLTANDQPIPLFALHRDQGTVILRGTLPPTALMPPFTRLTFQVDRTLSQQDLNPDNLDNRPVGVALDLIQIFPVDQQAIASLIGDPFQHQVYQDTVNFVKTHLQPEEQVFAPTIFSIQLGDSMPDVTDLQGVGQYPTTTDPLTCFDWVIVSKAIRREIGLLLMKLPVYGFKPVYADEVFVVFSTRRGLPTLPLANPHVKALYVGQVRFVIDQQIPNLYGAARSIKRSVRRAMKR